MRPRHWPRSWCTTCAPRRPWRCRCRSRSTGSANRMRWRFSPAGSAPRRRSTCSTANSRCTIARSAACAGGAAPRCWPPRCWSLALVNLGVDVLQLSRQSARLEALAQDAVRQAFPDLDGAQLGPHEPGTSSCAARLDRLRGGAESSGLPARARGDRTGARPHHAHPDAHPGIPQRRARTRVCARRTSPRSTACANSSRPCPASRSR